MTIVVTTTIERPPSDVFAAMSDLSRVSERMPALTRVEVISGAEKFGVGTRWRETRTIFGKEATEEMEVTAIDAPHSYDVEAGTGGTRYVSKLTFEPRNNGEATLVSMSFRAEPQTLAARMLSPLGWLAKSATRKMLLNDLNDMKQALEAETA